jgi:hypothetical protein
MATTIGFGRYIFLAGTSVASMFAGATAVHYYYSPDTSLPSAAEVAAYKAHKAQKLAEKAAAGQGPSRVQRLKDAVSSIASGECPVRPEAGASGSDRRKGE